MLNREIKFRGKSKDTGAWIYGSLFNASSGLTIIENGGDSRSDFHFVIPRTVGQFIGKKDKRKFDIYEGDIIKRNTGFVFEVEKKMFSLGDKNSAKAFGYDYHEEDEVIGNMFDNPGDCLKKTK